MDPIEQVAQFHRVFGHPILQVPTIPAPNRSALRIDLLKEELDELREAVQAKDIVAVADAICDLQYVLCGAILEFGLQNQFKALFDEVHRSNMSKACSSELEARKAVEAYAHQGIESFFVESDGVWLIYRRGDQKTLKSPAYFPPNLSAILPSVD